MFITDCLESHASENPTKCAYRFLKEGKANELTYAQLRAKARALAHILNQKVAPGGVALLLYTPGLDFIIAFLACLYAGIAAVPTYPPIARRLNIDIFRLEMICEDATPDIILADAAASKLLTAALFKENMKALLLKLIQLNRNATDTLTLDKTPLFVTEGIDSNEEYQAASHPHDIAFIQYSSGTTSQPKGIMVTHENLQHNIESIRKLLQLHKKSTMLGWLPHYHDMGLIGFILSPLVSQAYAILLSPFEFTEKPLLWLQALTDYRATHTGSPNFGYELCLKVIKQNLQAAFDLSNLELALCGAEPINSELPERFYEGLKGFGVKREVFFPVYGLAESTLLVAGGTKGRNPVVQTFDTPKLRHLIAEKTEEGSKLVGCGQSMDKHEILIVDPDTRAVQPEEHAGEIWLRGPSVTKGYWKKEQVTQEIYRAYTQEGQGPYLRTGDMGFFHEGELFFFGRIKDIILMRGKKYAPQDIESLVQSSHAGIRKGNVAAFSLFLDQTEQLVIVAEKSDKVKADNQHIFDAIRSTVAIHFDLPLYAIVLIKARSLNKTTSGKIQRQGAKKSFMTNSLHQLDAWFSPVSQAGESLYAKSH